jgi:hypothetical protein
VHLGLVGASSVANSTGQPLTRCDPALDLDQLDVVPSVPEAPDPSRGIDMEHSQTDRAVQCAGRWPEVPLPTRS